MKVIHLPFRAMQSILRHPVLASTITLLGLLIAFLAVLQLSPAAQNHFNAAMKSFGYSTASMIISSSADAALSASNATNRQLSSQLDVATKELDINKRETALLQQDVETKKQRIAQVDAFQKRANTIVKKHNVRLTKAVIKTAAGEIVAWVPVMGDAASVYFAIDGTIEMCNMFRELETTALEYGLPFYLYSGTFCDDPIKKSKAIVVNTYQDLTGSISESLHQQSDSRSSYWTDRIEEFVNLWK